MLDPEKNKTVLTKN